MRTRMYPPGFPQQNAWQGSPYSFGPWHFKGSGPSPTGGKGEVSNVDVLAAVIAGNDNVNQKFLEIQIQMGKLQSEMTQIRADMVTQDQFVSLEARVDVLEKTAVLTSTHHPEVQFLRS